MLPVCAGWMPTPVACLLNRPWMTLILGFSGSSGSRRLAELHVGARAFGAPVIRVDAVAHEQDGEPLREGAGARWRRAKAGSDSSQGRAIVTPAPRRTVRREMRSADFCRSIRTCSFTFLLLAASARRLFRNCGLVTMVSTRARSGSRSRPSVACICSTVGSSESMQRPAEGVGQQLAAQVVDELVLAVLADVGCAGRRGPRPRCRRGTSPACPPGGRRGPWRASRRPGRSLRTPGRTNRTAAWQPAQAGLSRCRASISRSGRSELRLVAAAVRGRSAAAAGCSRRARGGTTQ